MTATLSPLPAPRRPARSGEPWTEDDYVTLVRLCTEGADLATVAEALERRDTAVLNRTRRMLPLDERGLPADRALTQLRLHLEQEPGYDWAARLTESPPPRPVQHTTYTVQRNGIPGLQDEELLDVAELVVTGASTRSGTQRQVLRAVLERRLEHTAWPNGSAAGSSTGPCRPGASATLPGRSRTTSRTTRTRATEGRGTRGEAGPPPPQSRSTGNQSSHVAVVKSGARSRTETIDGPGRRCQGLEGNHSAADAA